MLTFFFSLSCTRDLAFYSRTVFFSLEHPARRFLSFPVGLGGELETGGEKVGGVFRWCFYCSRVLFTSHSNHSLRETVPTFTLIVSPSTKSRRAGFKKSLPCNERPSSVSLEKGFFTHNVKRPVQTTRAAVIHLCARLGTEEYCIRKKKKKRHGKHKPLTRRV